MERDMDLIRDLLLRIASNPEMDGTTEVIYGAPEDLGIEGHSLEELAYHARLLIEGGYLKGNPKSGYAMPFISRLTWKGHEFKDDISDPGTWAKTKDRLKGLPSAGLAVIADIAKAEIKKKLGLP